MKNNKVKVGDHLEDSNTSKTRFRFGNGKLKFPNWGSKKSPTHSSTVENGLSSIFTKAAQHPGKSATDISINNSLVSLGFAVASTNVRDLYQVINTSFLAIHVSDTIFYRKIGCIIR